MKFVMNFPVYDGCLEGYGTMADVAADCKELGLDGIEAIWDHRPYTQEMPPADLVVGYHLMFWSYWVDFWQQNRAALLEEFGDGELVEEYFHGTTRESMVAQYRADLQRAVDFQAEYTVFHVSEVSLRECFTYDFAHTDEEVIDCSAEIANRMLDGMGFTGAFLVENQWWPGLTFTRPEMTRRLLERIEYPNKGVMLDTGHLLHTNTALRTQAQAAAYVRDMWEAHGGAASQVRGLHLHQSLSGAYVEETGYRVPDDWTGTYWERYSTTYQHILQIDRHEPWTDPAIAAVVRDIAPEWVNSELSAWPRAAHDAAVRTQLGALRAGGLL